MQKNKYFKQLIHKNVYKKAFFPVIYKSPPFEVCATFNA